MTEGELTKHAPGPEAEGKSRKRGAATTGTGDGEGGTGRYLVLIPPPAPPGLQLGLSHSRMGTIGGIEQPPHLQFALKPWPRF